MAEEQANRIMPDNCEATRADSDTILVELEPTVGSSENITIMEALNLGDLGKTMPDPVGGVSSSLHGSSASSCEYFSTRIERLTQMRSEYSTALEYEIEASKYHWSEVVQGKELVASESELEMFEKLRKQCSSFFHTQTAWSPGDGDDGWVHGGWVVGEKIAEGAQGEIFEALSYLNDGSFNTEAGRKWVMKVFNEGTSLQNLHQQWPIGMVQKLQELGCVQDGGNNCGIFSGLLLKNGRFAFVMRRYWGDLRKLIDLRMQHNHINHNRSSPFKYNEVKLIMEDIAKGIEYLHKGNVLHRDLKASNVLVWAHADKDINLDMVHTDLSYKLGGADFGCDVADFECSVGVVGTEYWRAPEVLEAVKSGVRPIPSDVFTEKSDVYSYAMTCYEILTGRIPFEDLRRTAYDVVIDGARPTVPDGTQPWIKELLNRCWNADPSQRPSFKEIVVCIKQN